MEEQLPQNNEVYDGLEYDRKRYYTNPDFIELFRFKNLEEELEFSALMIGAGFLSEIEFVMRDKGITRKELATKIKTSASYLTQVFRGDKPLNMITIAKIKRVLDIDFTIKARPLPNIDHEVVTPKQLSR